MLNREERDWGEAYESYQEESDAMSVSSAFFAGVGICLFLSPPECNRLAFSRNLTAKPTNDIK